MTSAANCPLRLGVSLNMANEASVKSAGALERAATFSPDGGFANDTGM